MVSMSITMVNGYHLDCGGEIVEHIVRGVAPDLDLTQANLMPTAASAASPAPSYLHRI